MNMSLYANFPLFVVNFITASAPVPPPLSPENARAAIDLVTFRRILRAVDNQSFDSGRFDALRMVCAAQPRFTCAQAAELVACFTFGAGQTNAAILLHRHVIDPVRFEDVVDALAFETDKRTVRRAVQIGGAL